jgi:hypothetical protein
VFYIDVAKIDQNVARVATVFQVYVLNVSSIFRCILQVFYLDVAKVDLNVVYTCILQAYVSSVSGVSYVCCKDFI